MNITLPAADAGIEITASQVSELLPAISRGELDLIDCREEEEWRFNHIPGARLIPLSRFSEAPSPTRPVIVYCHHGMRSLRAAAFLRARGVNDVWSMAGGIDRWSSEIDPTVPTY